jgi:hypothetical protein
MLGGRGSSMLNHSATTGGRMRIFQAQLEFPCVDAARNIAGENEEQVDFLGSARDYRILYRFEFIKLDIVLSPFERWSRRT